MKGSDMKLWGCKSIAVVIFAAALATGCTRRMGDFTYISTKNLNLAKFTTEDSQKAQPVTGEDQKWIVILPGSVPNVEDAVDRALEGSDAQALTNARIYYKVWYVPYVVGQWGFVVKGQPVKN